MEATAAKSKGPGADKAFVPPGSHTVKVASLYALPSSVIGLVAEWLQPPEVHRLLTLWEKGSHNTHAEDAVLGFFQSKL